LLKKEEELLEFSKSWSHICKVEIKSVRSKSIQRHNTRSIFSFSNTFFGYRKDAKYMVLALQWSNMHKILHNSISMIMDIEASL